MISQQRWLASSVWYFISVLPLGAVSLWWAAMSNPAPITKWVVLGVIGAAFGATLFNTVGEILRPTSGANAQTSPSASQPPPVNQGPCSAFSLGQQGGTTQGCVIVPKPQSRHLVPSEIETIADTIQGKRLAVVVIDVGGEEPRSFGDEIRAALAAGGASVENFSISAANPPFYGLQISQSSPDYGREALRAALTSARLPVDIANGIVPIPVSVWSQYQGKTVLIVGLHPDLRMKP